MKGLSLVVGLLLVGGVTTFGDETDAPPAADSSHSAIHRASSPEEGAVSNAADSRSRRDGSTSSDSRTRSPKATQTTQPEVHRSARLYVVARIVDGDTVELGNGETVRLAGIDTPEIGVCGYEQAAANLSRLVLRKQVRLGATDEDRDRYGRLLRYINVGDLDAGLRLIKNGYAIARYDSRDGYGYHPREPRYIAADRASQNFTCPNPAPPPPVPPGCAAGYTPCIHPYPPDLDCADVNGPIRVTGSDPHGLDGDGDGIACE